MEKVTVNKSDLLTKVQTNRDNHREVFESALEQYEKDIVSHLKHMIADAKAGKRISHYIDLPQPQDHTQDYDRVITMLTMAKDSEITIAERDFNMYVMDEWGWNASFAETTALYAASNVNRPSTQSKALRMSERVS